MRSVSTMCTQSRLTASMTDLARMAGDVIHDGEHAAVRLRGGSHVASDGVAESQHRGVVETDREPLQEHAGEVVLLHPAEVSIHGPRL